MGHTSNVGTTQSLAEPFSRGATTSAGDQGYSGRGASADLNAPDLMDAADDAEESGEEDSYDVDDFLNHDIFNA